MSKLRVPSTDGVELSVTDLGGDGPLLAIAHATGFCGAVYRPLADRLRATYRCVTWDFRGHGDSSPPTDGVFAWDGFGDDVLAVVDALDELVGDAPGASPAPGGLLAVGHSKGGAALLLAEQRRPGTFAALYLYEPVVFPPVGFEELLVSHPLAEGARRRRATFKSVEDAIANYGSKPPLNELSDESLRAYVEHGFAPDPEGIRIKCNPEHEAATFEMGPRHRAWEHLGQVECPVRVASGADVGVGPSSVAAEIASLLPRGELRMFDDLGHFGPLADPDRIAADIVSFFGT